jgi:hypothetical protein
MPTARDVARIDSNMPCPACGARSGKLLTVVVGGVRSELGQLIGADTMVQHTCDVCKGIWFENPIVKISPQKVQGSKPELKIA